MTPNQQFNQSSNKSKTKWLNYNCSQADHHDLQSVLRTRTTQSPKLRNFIFCMLFISSRSYGFLLYGSYRFSITLSFFLLYYRSPWRSLAKMIQTALSTFPLSGTVRITIEHISSKCTGSTLSVSSECLLHQFIPRLLN